MVSFASLRMTCDPIPVLLALSYPAYCLIIVTRRRSPAS
jgi:hypothetical protein